MTVLNSVINPLRYPLVKEATEALSLLRRIAVALERIADNTEPTPTKRRFTRG